MKTFISLEQQKIKTKLTGCKLIWSTSPYACAVLIIAVNIHLQELLVSFAASSGYPLPYNSWAQASYHIRCWILLLYLPLPEPDHPDQYIAREASHHSLQLIVNHNPSYKTTEEVFIKRLQVSWKTTVFINSFLLSLITPYVDCQIHVEMNCQAWQEKKY